MSCKLGIVAVKAGQVFYFATLQYVVRKNDTSLLDV